jgi:hypothetical protein
MKQEILDFYAERNIPVRKMISVGAKQSLTPESIAEAAEIVYDEIQNGLEIKPIRIAWRVYATAKHLVMTHEVKKDNTISETYQIVKELKSMLEWHMMPWYKKLWRWINGNRSTHNNYIS